MPKKNQGSVALITGSTAGLGKELAFQLCSRGVRVALNGRDQGNLDRTQQEFSALGFDTIAVQGDVSSPEDCRQMIEQCIDAFKRLDILISNAGIGSAGPFEDTAPAAFKKVFEVNTLGSIYITRFAIPHIQETQGSIVFISSIAGMVGLPFSSLYSGSKMALTAIGQALQVEMKDSGVHVGIAYAGFLENGPGKRIMGPEGEFQPLGKRDSYRLQPMHTASKRVIRMIERRQSKIVLSSFGKVVYFGQRFTPWLIRMILVKSRERARKTYEPQS